MSFCYILPIALSGTGARYLPVLRVYTVYLSLIVGPRAELQETGLLVEREVGDVDLAGTAKSRRRRPEHVPSAVNHRVGRHVTDREVIRAATRRKFERLRGVF